jgi:hypothetical protein
MRTHYGGTVGRPFDDSDPRKNDIGRAEEAFVRALFPGVTDKDILEIVKGDIIRLSDEDKKDPLTEEEFFEWATGDLYANDMIRQFMTLDNDERIQVIEACNNIVALRREDQEKHGAASPGFIAHKIVLQNKTRQCNKLEELHKLLIQNDIEAQEWAAADEDKEISFREKVVDDILHYNTEKLHSRDEVLEKYNEILEAKKVRLSPPDSGYTTSPQIQRLWDKYSPGEPITLQRKYTSPYSKSKSISRCKAKILDTKDELASHFDNLLSPRQQSLLRERIVALNTKKEECSSTQKPMVERLISEVQRNKKVYSDRRTKLVEVDGTSFNFENNELRIAVGGTVSGEGTSTLSLKDRAIRNLKKKIRTILNKKGKITEFNELIISDLAEEYISSPEIFSGENVPPEIKETLVAEYNELLSQQPEPEPEPEPAFVHKHASGNEGEDGLGGGKPKRRKGNKTRKGKKTKTGNKTRKGNKKTNTNKTKKHKGKKTRKRKRM